MTIFELLVLAVGLSMDAFAVSVCKGLSVKKAGIKEMCCAGAWFGGFQALMPAIGFLLGSTFSRFITNFDHWIAVVLLAFIGVNMLREAFSKEEENEIQSDGKSPMNAKEMFLMAVATSIDALAVGITFALLPNVNIFAAVSFIGVTTFLFSAGGIKIGNAFGTRFKSKAEIAGGLILIGIGLKILIEHLIEKK